MVQGSAELDAPLAGDAALHGLPTKSPLAAPVKCAWKCSRSRMEIAGPATCAMSRLEYTTRPCASATDSCTIVPDG